MAEPTKKDGFEIAMILGLVAVICLVCVVGYGYTKLDRRVVELNSQVMIAQENNAKFEAALKELASKPDVSERIAMLEAWIEVADPQLAAMFGQLLQRDEILRGWIMALKDRVEALEAKPVVEAPKPPVIVPKPPSKPVSKPKKVKKQKPKAQKRCNKPVVRCDHSMPMVCTVQ